MAQRILLIIRRRLNPEYVERLITCVVKFHTANRNCSKFPRYVWMKHQQATIPCHTRSTLRLILFALIKLVCSVRTARPDSDSDRSLIGIGLTDCHWLRYECAVQSLSISSTLR